MTASTGATGDGRVGYALINQELKQINVKLTEISDTQKMQGNSLAIVVTGLAVACSERDWLNERIDTNKDEIDALRKSNSIWSGINSIISMIAAAFAAALGLGSK